MTRSARVVYSMGQACSNTYEPVLSLYVVFAGAYIKHTPLPLLTKQLTYKIWMLLFLVVIGGGAWMGVFINIYNFRHVYFGIQLRCRQRRMPQ